jgi:hypothetical protein
MSEQKKSWGTPAMPANAEQPPTVALMPTATGPVPITTGPQWTPEQLAAWERREAARKRWMGPPIIDTWPTPARQAAADAERDQREAAERFARWGDDPRVGLRAAHETHRIAAAETARRKHNLLTATAFLDEAKETYAAAERDAATAAGAAVSAIKTMLEGGTASGSAALATPVDEHLARARRDVKLAQQAHDEIAAAVPVAEQSERVSRVAIALAAEAVIIARGLEIADRIAVLKAELGELRRELGGLDVVWIRVGDRPRAIKLPRRLAALFINVSPAGAEQRWAALLRALQDDPEA